MGGGLAGPELAGAVTAAGGLGTLGLLPPADLREAIGQVRDVAPDRSVAVNLLMPLSAAAMSTRASSRESMWPSSLLGWIGFC